MKLEIPEVSEPDWGEEDDLDEDPEDMDITAVFDGLTSGKTYTVFKYHHPDCIPDSDLENDENWVKTWQFKAEATTHTLEDFDTISTKSISMYRTIEYGDEIDEEQKPKDKICQFALKNVFSLLTLLISISGFI